MIVRVTAKVSRAGDRGTFFQFAGSMSAEALGAATRALEKRFAPAAAITGHSSVLLLFAGTARVLPPMLELDIEPSVDERSVRHHTIAVSFDAPHAPDLGDVLAQLGISREEFLRTLTGTALRVRFRGFLPGFAYLDGLPASWNVPRRSTSRTRVPKGSLGLAAGMAGFYPAESPGGWNIIGRSAARFWDARSAPPALLSPGDSVRIEVTGALSVEETQQDATPSTEAIATCLSAGQHTMIVSAPDLRRCEQGLAVSGAFDPYRAAVANASAGNSPSCGVLECSLVGPELRFERAGRVAWDGADVAWERNGTPIDGRSVDVRAGDIVRVGRLSGGLRGWLAISGGIASPGGMYASAPSRVAKGERLRADEAAPAVAAPERSERRDPHVIDVIAGPHDADLGTLLSCAWIVTPLLDRTGIRLRPDGPPVSAPASIPSCGMQFGSVQLHPNGDLVVMGPDHPVTGGYLQPFTVVSSDLWKLAQLQPGQRVRWSTRKH